MTGLPMTMISTRWAELNSIFDDLDSLGIFLDNHDKPRFLNSHILPSLYKSALAFSLTARGITMMYYGSEQGLKGGNDPYNREELWNSF
jgi:alpha-amylase